MKIYTTQGDDGFSTRPGGRRVRKNHPILCAVGDMDELNAHLGFCVSAAGQGEIHSYLQRTQGKLLTAGAMLSAVGTNTQPGVQLDDEDISGMESEIDAVSRDLRELKNFIIPGGCELACRLHVALTVCRRAERSIVAASAAGMEIPPIIFRYFNRLGDLLFVLARAANKNARIDDRIWNV